jgi:hypothetical protein
MPTEEKKSLPLPSNTEGVQVDLSSLPYSNPHNIRPVYSNNASAMVTVWDMRLTFTEIVLEPDGGRVEMRASVVMALNHAKALAQLLNHQIAAYEKANGEVRIPKGTEETPPAANRAAQ